MGIEIAENEKALKNTASMLPAIEKRVQEQTDKVLEDVRSNVLKEAKGLFVPVIDEYRASLELLKSTLSDELKRFKGEVQDHTGLVYQKIDELNSSIEACGSKLTSFESETIISLKEKIAELDSALNETKRKIEKTEKESVRVFLKKAEDEYNNYINVLENSQAAYKGNIFQKIEERAKDLSTYVTRLEGRVQNLLDDVKKETDKYGEVLNLKIKTHESEADALKSRIISEINEEANKNLLLIKPIASEMNEKLLAYKKEFATIFGHMESGFKGHKETIDKEITLFKEELDQQKSIIINQIDTRVKDTGRKLTEVSARLEEGIREATDGVSKNL